MMDWIVWWIYFADVSGRLQEIAGFAAFISFVLFVLAILVNVAARVDNPGLDESSFRLLGRATVWLLVTTLLTTTLYTIIPSQKAVNYMIAAKAVSLVVEAEDVKRIVPESARVLEQYLEKIASELENHQRE